MKPLLISISLALAVASASATPITPITNYSYNAPTVLGAMDHHFAYTWRIDNISLAPSAVITSASLTFTSIYNWDNSANMLFIHLLDTAKNAGVASFVDAPPNQVPVNDITDDFANTRFHNDPKWLVANGTADTFLTQRSFAGPGQATTYTFNFTAAELLTLRQYIANGHNIAFGLDSDCHYFDKGIIFRFTTRVPDAGGTVALFSAALVLMILLRAKLSVAPSRVRLTR